ncbi:MAG TPA: protein kinase, partial [Streptosporangiaceae bacterium]|nr:protein kinase [Streptosporangiaceae bacterium]
MSADTLITGQAARAGNGGGQAREAEWSVPGYTELKALGSGGSGDVVLARHDASGTVVAIKYLRRQLLADPQWALLFRAEAQVLAYLDDPNIVRLYEYVESPSGAAIVMELVDGVSVREILAHQGATTPEAALVVLQGSLLGLAAAHRRGIVHRDYKPENVLVDGDGDSKLTDFGIAARIGAEPVAAGSLLYAPPEQFAGTPASPAGDVYAATATFYECLTGHPPFTGDTAERLLYQHLTEPVPLDPVPGPLRPLVAAGMAKEPENRPADATTFVTALNAIASRAYGPDWAERGRLALGAAALLLAALWPSGAPAAVQGSAVEQVNLSPRNAQQARESRHLWHVRHLRHLLHLRNLRYRRGLRRGPVKAVIAAGAAVAVVAAGAALLAGRPGHGSPPSVTLPAVTGVSPAGGTDMGGTTVTITGTGLADATLVTFGGVAGRITAESDTRITVASPPSTGTTGITVTAAAITVDSSTAITGASRPGTDTVDIAVTTPFGTSRPAAADHFTYTAPRPAVTGVAPDGGSTAGGTTVSIIGTGLAGATAVRFGAVAGRIIADSNTQVTVTSPRGTGTVTVTVTTQAGASQTTAAGQYTYTAHPKRTQSIPFTAPAPATAGGSAALSASGGGSGNPVLFSVDPASGPGVCTVSGRTVSYAMEGPCVIDANQAGNATYAAAAQVQRMIMVAGKSQSITFTAPASGTVGDSAALSASGGGSGNPVVFSVDPASGAGVCTVSGSTVSYAAAGSCVIDADQAGNAAYATAAQAQQMITVTSGQQQTTQKKTQSITFTNPGAGTAGGSATLPATATSGLPVVFSVGSGSGAGVCTLSGSTVSYAAAGSCVVDANQAGDATYAAAAQAQQTITITAIPQSISFTAPASGTAGGSAALSATGGGSGNPVVFSVDPASGPGVCTVSGSTVTYPVPGSCVIDANQAGNAAYSAAQQVRQTITITSNSSQTYDGVSSGGPQQSQSISFTAPASGTAGGSAALSATGGGSGNPVVFSVDPASGPGVCTV